MSWILSKDCIYKDTKSEHRLCFNTLYLCVFSRVPTRSSWRWNWTARSWRAEPSGWRGQWRKKNKRKQTTEEPQGGREGAPPRALPRAPPRAPPRARGGREEVLSLKRNSQETSKGRPKAPDPSKDKWWIQLKRKNWRRKWSQTRAFTSDPRKLYTEHMDSTSLRKHKFLPCFIGWHFLLLFVIKRIFLNLKSVNCEHK